MSKTIHWVLTHEPIALFEEAAKRFAELVNEGSKGAIQVSVSTPSAYGDGQYIPPQQVAADVAAGRLEMAQTYTTVLGTLADRLWALDLPFLFGSHEHAARVLDGAIGRELLDDLLPHGIRGLAFTYSGGYRIVASKSQPITRLEDFSGLRIRTSDNPVVKHLFESLGATVVPAPLRAIPELADKHLIDAAESTWPRYWDMGHFECQPVVNETSHSLFLTSLIINEAFYQSLEPKHQQLLSEAARVTASLERDKSVRDGLIARAEYLDQKGQVVTLDQAESQRLERAARGTLEAFSGRFGRELIDRIRADAFRSVG